MKKGRNESAESSGEPLIAIARAVRTRGLKGELVADLLTDFPERFALLVQLVAVSPDGERRVVRLEDHWFQKGRVILKLDGYDSIEAARSLIGYEFAVPESDRVKLAEDEYYDWELEGCKVETVAGQWVGTVKSVMRTGGVNLLVIENDREHDEKPPSLVPMVKSILVKVDKKRKSIVIDPLMGLLEL
jgi:16S rRNA processing protein RimM